MGNKKLVTMKSKEQIQQEIEDYLKKDNVFEFILRSNLTLFKVELTQLNFDETNKDSASIYFECRDSFLKFAGVPIIYEFLKDEYEMTYRTYEYLYIRDFEYDGFICKIGGDRIKAKIEATIMILTRDQNNQLSYCSIIPELIDVTDFSSYRVWAFKDRDNEFLQLQNQLKTKITLIS
jgi:hypothetical protein